MHSNVTIKNVTWPNFSWATLYKSDNTSYSGILTKALWDLYLDVWDASSNVLPLNLTPATHYWKLIHKTMWFRKCVERRMVSPI